MGGAVSRPLHGRARRLWKFFYLFPGISDKNTAPRWAVFFNPLTWNHLPGLHKKLGKVGKTAVTPKVFL
jgi:hypothetical protein